MKRGFAIGVSAFLAVVGIVARAAAEDTVKVAVIFALSGEAAQDNSGSYRGTVFGLEQANKHGGLLGKQIEILHIDNKSTKEGSTEAAQKAVDAGVIGILGASWSSHSIELAKVAQAHKTPMITNVSTNPAVTQVGDYIFRACFTDDYQGTVAAQFALDELKARTAVILRDRDEAYSTGLALAFTQYFTSHGGKVLEDAGYTIDEKKDFAGLLSDVKKLAPDVLFLPGHHETAKIMTQAQDIGNESAFLGGDGWVTPGFDEMGGAHIKRAFFTTHWYKESERPESRQFVKAFGDNEYLIAPGALGFDAASLFVDAVRRAGSFDRAKIRDSIAATKGFRGVTGDITIGPSRDPMGKAAVIMLVSEGGKVTFYKQMTTGQSVAGVAPTGSRPAVAAVAP